MTCSPAFGQVIKIELVIDYESRDPELYNDKTGLPKAELSNF